MSGYTIVVGNCFACKRVFGFNPLLVPSVLIDPVRGLPPDMGGDPERAKRQPVCRSCMERANERRVATGAEAVPIHPEAYDPLEGWPE